MQHTVAKFYLGKNMKKSLKVVLKTTVLHFVITGIFYANIIWYVFLISLKRDPFPWVSRISKFCKEHLFKNKNRCIFTIYYLSISPNPHPANTKADPAMWNGGSDRWISIRVKYRMRGSKRGNLDTLENLNLLIHMVRFTKRKLSLGPPPQSQKFSGSVPIQC